PTRPGQVVVIAGEPENYRTARDGEYAVKASAMSDGGLAVDPANGLVYFRALGNDDPRVQRIERDGRVTILRVKNWGDQVAIFSDDLWIMSSSRGPWLSRTTLPTLKETDLINDENGNMVKVLAPSGDPLPSKDLKGLSKYWSDSRFVIRSDGVPIIVSRAGSLFEAVGPNRLKEWEPEGYEDALRDVSQDKELRPSDVVTDGKGGIVVLAAGGLLRVAGDGRTQGVRFRAPSGSLPSWSAVLPLDNGSVLLLGGTSALEPSPRPALVRPNGSIEILSFGGRRACGEFDGSMAVIASANPGGIAKMPDGSYVMHDGACGRVYRLRLPNRLSGAPVSGK
ncbi:hypothetical protein, partial [Actinomadura rubrisoli]|uniref:hypothetical protein n=1 Tax=Actinomadura rubrisoli TaxID=2530368 RepID=UPI0014046921